MKSRTFESKCLFSFFFAQSMIKSLPLSQCKPKKHCIKKLNRLRIQSGRFSIDGSCHRFFTLIFNIDFFAFFQLLIEIFCQILHGLCQSVQLFFRIVKGDGRTNQPFRRRQKRMGERRTMQTASRCDAKIRI